MNGDAQASVQRSGVQCGIGCQGLVERIGGAAQDEAHQMIQLQLVHAGSVAVDDLAKARAQNIHDRQLSDGMDENAVEILTAGPVGRTHFEKGRTLGVAVVVAAFTHQPYDQYVDAIATIEEIIAISWRPDEGIVPLLPKRAIAIERIEILGATNQHIIAVGAEQYIDTQTARDHIGVGRALKLIAKLQALVTAAVTATVTGIELV